jgi:glycosyltransferase involved in cell wall biosynthesis
MLTCGFRPGRHTRAPGPPCGVHVRILIDYRPALRQRSGVGEYIFRLLQALREVRQPGDELAIFSSSWKDRVDRRELGGIGVVDARIPVRVLNRLWHRREWPPVELMAGRFHVVHAAGPTLIPAKHAAQVVTVHDLDFLAHPERTWAEMRRDYGALVERHVLRADHVVVNSAYTAGEVHQRLGVPLARITVCRPGGVGWTARRAAKPGAEDAGSGAPGTGAAGTGAAALVTGQKVTAGGVSLEPGYILFVGTLEPRKNVGGLLDSYTRLVQRWPDAPRLVLAGRTVPLSKPWLEALAKEPLASKAVHLGYVADSEREALYKGASVLVLPSFNEGFGLPVLEAMTVGVPVIAANRGALPEVLGDAGLLIDPDDPDSLTAALERMLTDTALARRLAARGLRRTRLFDWIASARALRSAYDEAVAYHAARGPRAGR